MPFCSECGKEISNFDGGLCANCKVKYEKSKKNQKKNRIGKWYNMARGLNYPVTFTFIVLILINYFALTQYILPAFGLVMHSEWYWEIIRAVILIVFGIIAIGREGPSLIATIGMLAVIVPLLIGIWALFMLVYELIKLTT